MFAGDTIAPEPCASEFGSAANGARRAQHDGRRIRRLDGGERIPERTVRRVALLVHHPFDVELDGGGIAGRPVVEDDARAKLQRHRHEIRAHLVGCRELRHDLHVGVEIEQPVVDAKRRLIAGRIAREGARRRIERQHRRALADMSQCLLHSARMRADATGGSNGCAACERDELPAVHVSPPSDQPYDPGRQAPR